MPRRLFRKPSKQSRNYSSRVSNGPIHAPNRIPRFLRIPDLPLERGFIPTVAFGTHRNGRNRDSFAFRTAVRQALELLRQARLATPQPLPACLPFLRQPVSAMRPLQSLRNLLGMDQKLAQISPNQGIQPLGRRQPRWALLLAMGEQGGQLAGAGIVAIPVDRGPG